MRKSTWVFNYTSAKGVKASTALNGGLNGGMYQKIAQGTFLNYWKRTA